MELKKGRYKKAEVEKMLNENTALYQEKIQQLKGNIVDLAEQNKTLQAELDLLKNNQDLISTTLMSAEKQAQDMESVSEQQYLATLESLYAFSIKWKNYFNYLKEKYPFYPAVKQVVSLKEEINKALGYKTNKEGLNAIKDKFEKTANDSQFFDPKAKIQDYIVATSDNGFNLDEVLNPGDLRLEDLCKELGLLEEND